MKALHINIKRTQVGAKDVDNPWTEICVRGQNFVILYQNLNTLPIWQQSQGPYPRKSMATASRK